MPAIINHVTRAFAHVYETVTGKLDTSTYTRLPLTITRTASSSDSYDLGKKVHDADFDEDSSWWHVLGGQNGWSDGASLSSFISTNKRRVILSSATILSSIAVAAFVYQAAFRLPTPLFDAAVENDCSTVSVLEAGWFKHPTVHLRGNSLPPDRTLKAQEFQQRVSQACADLWISRGEICKDISAAIELGENIVGDANVDVAWSFVEPSPYWRKWETAYKNDSTAEETEGLGDKHFRSFDEIRYSIRSVIENLPWVKKMTLLATSLPPSPPPAGVLQDANAYSEQFGCRLAQTPEWMDLETVRLNPFGGSNETSKLEVLSHWEQFDAQTEDQEEVLRWKHSVLPTFNSHSIESQLYNLPNPSETVLYLNNDCYIGRPLLPSDMSTRLLGPVFKIYPFSWSTGALSLEDAMAVDGEGNARVMPNTIRHLDNRFGRRDRNYPEHVGVALSMPTMAEVAKIWAEELKDTAGIRYRGGGPEIWLPLINMYYIIEKQREATLWSFVVARSDVDGSGFYTLAERQTMLVDLGGTRDGDIIRFATPKRSWNDKAHKKVISEAGITVPTETQLYWSAANGYPYVSGGEGNSIFPNYDGSRQDFCAVSIEVCFGRVGFFDDEAEEEGDYTPDQLMKRVAFERIKCGDCLIAALLARSGDRGFEAFLPEASKHPNPSTLDTQHTVPLIGGWNKTWEGTEFSLNKVVSKGWNRRDFAVRLIQRYTYAFGETPTAFNELNDDPGWIGWFLWRWTQDRASYMAMNDHVTTDNVTLQEQIQEQVSEFQQSMWPNATLYELEH